MQLVVSGNRILAHGEDCFLAMGGTVICTKTGRVFQNATVVTDCENCPADIDEVGYEYHAGEFVPCAPYGVHGIDGHIMVSCGDCATPKRSKYKLSELAKIEVGSYVGSGAALATLDFERAPSTVLIVGGGSYGYKALNKDYHTVTTSGVGILSAGGGFAATPLYDYAPGDVQSYVGLSAIDVREFGQTVTWTSGHGINSYGGLSNSTIDPDEPTLNTSGITYRYIAFFDWGE